MEIPIPPNFQCPISLELMKDPVTLSTGITYDRESIEKWSGTGHTTCPVTKQVLKTPDLIPNHAVRKIIQDWCVQNRPYDIEPVLTPQIPITQYEVSDEYVLSSSFESYASVSVEKHACLLIEILSRLTWMFPLGVEAQSKLASSTSLRCMAWFLRGEDVSGRRVAVLALGELLALDQGYANAFAEMEGVAEALVKIIRVPICPRATKASLMAIYHMISPSTMSEEMTRRFMEMGLVSLILEIVVNYEKGICEKALGVLDCMCDCDDGREYLARNHESTMPVLVEKILGVSVTATEFSVSALWKLCKDENGGVVVDEAVHELGVFEKLLVVLQVGCDERTKERANELLKLFTRYKERLDFDSSILFKHLKRPY